MPMAFNPFHGFRKYKKTMFAVLTIICMFVFILSSGLGGGADLFNRRLFGGSRYPEVARLDGHKIDSDELNQVRNRRRLANEFMSMVVSQAQAKTVGDLQAKLESIPEIARYHLNTALQQRRLASMAPQYFAEEYQRSIPNFVRGVETAASVLERDKKTADAELVRRFQRV